MENNDIKTITDVVNSAPFSNDGIYLQSSDKNTIAVCSTSGTACLIANILNHYEKNNNNKESQEAKFEENLENLNSKLASLRDSVKCNANSKHDSNEDYVNDKNNKQESLLNDQVLYSKIKITVNKYSDFLQKARYLDIAIQQAKIPVNSINSMLLEKSYHEFKKALDKLIQDENLEIVSREDN